MANDTNKSSLMRIAVPLAALAVGVLVVLSLLQPPADEAEDSPGQDAPQAEADTTPAASGTAQSEAADAPPGGEAAPVPQAPTDATAEADHAPGALDNPRPAFADTPASLDEPGDLITLGSLDPATDDNPGYAVAARINPYRAAVYDLSITNEFHKVDRKDNYKLLNPISFDLFNQAGEKNTDYPEAGTYAAQKITINGTPVALARKDPETGHWLGHWNVVSQRTDQVTLELDILAGPEDDPKTIARVVRTYSLPKAGEPNDHTVRLSQHVENLTDQPMTVRWEQLAQGGIYHATNDYLRGRSNQYVLGHFDLKHDPQRFAVHVGDDAFLPEPDVIDRLKDPSDSGRWTSVWPNPKIDNPQAKLAWLASENRYFVAISSAVTDASEAMETGDITALQSVYPTVTTTIYPNVKLAPGYDDQKRQVILGLVSNELTIAPGKTSDAADLSLDLFAGPREDAIFAAQPYKALQYDKTIRYSLGGMCGFCTFQWLANLLLGFLELLYAVVFDWGIAIVILVLVVRVCLHPLTKRGQTNMMKMGKQMAAVQPEMNKLKKKFADDPRQMQAAQMQLFREKGINPAAGALGCLPMFLQMPIWIALYAMLYYAIELRHEPAFFGVFQMFGGWEFLADLSSADRFIPIFPDDGTHVFELIFIRLDYSSINILPILMGITFFINMKFTTPPPMNEQQATQQKIMKIMPLLFPFFLYSAPAGLTLYICASTLAGIVDSYIVRKHVKQMEESGELFKPKQRKPGGMMDRLQKAAEARMQQAEELKKQQQQAKNKGPQSYKKRKR